MTTSAILALADGSVFHGEAAGFIGSATGEVVFNTAMTGYQEILSDPSYSGQMVCLTCPHIGNTGINDQDQESAGVAVSGLLIRDLPRHSSSWRQTDSLDDYLRRHEVPCISGLDTRRLTHRLRDGGAQSGCLLAGPGVREEEALARARACPPLQGRDLVRAVTTRAPYTWEEGSHLPAEGYAEAARPAASFHVVVYDFGVKRSLLRMLVDRGCRLTVVPATTPASEALALRPDGVLLSNGPGDPEPCSYALQAIGELLQARLPILGICLGMQLLALSCGARVVKMKFGHHGANHPVRRLSDGRVMITSQNHGFVVDEASLPKDLEVSHRSLFDGSLQGIRLAGEPVMAFQGHPEASPGPHDGAGYFDWFVAWLRERQGLGLTTDHGGSDAQTR